MTVEELYHLMATEMGPQPWLRPGTPWAETPVEIMLGAILVQNTNWRNVEPALLNLKQATGVCTSSTTAADSGGTDAFD